MGQDKADWGVTDFFWGNLEKALALNILELLGTR
jgi:hypothetical protein